MSRDYVKNQRSSRSAPQSSSSGPSGMVWLLVGVLMGLIIAGIFYVKNQHSLPAAEMAPSNVTPSITQPTKSPSSNTTTSNQSLQTQFDFYNVLPSQKIVGPSGDEDTSDINNQNNSINNPTPPTTATQQNSIQQDVTQQNSTQQNPAQTTTPTQNTTASAVTPTAQTPTVNSSSTTTLNSANPSNQTVSTSATPNSATTSKPAHTNSVTSSNSMSNSAQTPAMPKAENYILQIATFSQFTAADQLKAQLSLAGFEVNISQIQHNGKAMERVWVGPFHTQDEAETVQKQLQDNQISSKLLKSS